MITRTFCRGLKFAGVWTSQKIRQLWTIVNSQYIPHLQSTGTTSVKDIYLCDISQFTVKAFSDALCKQYPQTKVIGKAYKYKIIINIKLMIEVLCW